MVSSTPRPHFTPGKDPVPILQEAGWAPGPVWTGGISRPHREFFCPHLLPCYCYIPIHSLCNLPRIRRTGCSFCTVCHPLTVLPPLIITNPDALELFCHCLLTLRSLLLVIAVYLMLQGYRNSPQPLAIRMYLCHSLVHVYAVGVGRSLQHSL